MTRVRQWTTIRLGGAMLAATLLVAVGAIAQTGGLRDQRLMGQRPQRAAAVSQANPPLATVRLTVEGMVCYG
jgi:hypothetical protein